MDKKQYPEESETRLNQNPARETEDGKRVENWTPERLESDLREFRSSKPFARGMNRRRTVLRPLGFGSVIPFLQLPNGARQQLLGDVWDFRRRRLRDMVLMYLLLALVVYVEWNYSLTGILVENTNWSFRVERRGMISVLLLMVGSLGWGLTNNGLVLDRRTGLAWFWYSIFGCKLAVAVSLDSIAIKSQPNIFATSNGEGNGNEAVYVESYGKRYIVFRGNKARADDFAARLDTFLADGPCLVRSWDGSLDLRDKLIRLLFLLYSLYIVWEGLFSMVDYYV